MTRLTEHDALTKCAKLLGVQPEDFTSKVSLQVIATDEVLEPGRVVLLALPRAGMTKRFATVALLTREEWDLVRQFNARSRLKTTAKDLAKIALGTYSDNDKPGSTMQPTDAPFPSKGFRFYYLLREV